MKKITIKKVAMLALLVFTFAGLSYAGVNDFSAAKAPTVKKDGKKRVIAKTFYHKNNKTKQTNAYKYIGKTKKVKQRTVMNYNGKAINSKTTGYVYNYNKKGQLRTNKYGKATRVDYKYFLNNKVSAKRTCTYNAKGKLKCSKWNTKSYAKNKAIAVYKNHPAQYKNVATIIKVPGKPAVYHQDSAQDTFKYEVVNDKNWVYSGIVNVEKNTSDKNAYMNSVHPGLNSTRENNMIWYANETNDGQFANFSKAQYPTNEKMLAAVIAWEKEWMSKLDKNIAYDYLEWKDNQRFIKTPLKGWKKGDLKTPGTADTYKTETKKVLVKAAWKELIRYK